MDGDNLRKGFVMLLALIFSLFGCSEEKFSVHPYFSAGVYASTDEIDFSGDFSYSAKGKLTLKIKSPKELKDYTYTAYGNRIIMSYQGIKSEYSPEDFPDTAPIIIMRNIMKNIASSPPEIKKEEGAFTGRLQGYTVDFTQGGYIESIEGDNIHIAFVKKAK